MKFYLEYFNGDFDKFIERFVYCDIVQLSSDKKHILFYYLNNLVESVRFRDVITLKLC